MRQEKITFATAPSNGTRTSRIAADSIVRHAKTLRQKVFQALLSAGEAGLTREELETVCEMDGNTLRPRVWELIRAKSIRELPETMTRKTASGRQAAILTAY